MNSRRFSEIRPDAHKFLCEAPEITAEVHYSARESKAIITVGDSRVSITGASVNLLLARLRFIAKVNPTIGEWRDWLRRCYTTTWRLVEDGHLEETNVPYPQELYVSTTGDPLLGSIAIAVLCNDITLIPKQERMLDF